MWEHYGGESVFPSAWLTMMEAVDKGDAAQFTRYEVLDSTGWNLLNFLMDARTGLGRFREFRISNYNLMMDLIDYCTKHTIEEILDHPDVAERVSLNTEKIDISFSSKYNDVRQFMTIWWCWISLMKKRYMQAIGL